jgi:hypothetical protein
MGVEPKRTLVRVSVVDPKRAWRVSAPGKADQAPNSASLGSSAHIFIQKGEHVRLPDVHAKMEKVVSLIHSVADRWIDL